MHLDLVSSWYYWVKLFEALGRNPEAQSTIQTTMILAMAFAEALLFTHCYGYCINFEIYLILYISMGSTWYRYETSYRAAY